MAKAMALVDGITNFQNVVDGDILLDLNVWFFEDGHPGSEVFNDAAVQVQFDSTTSTTLINNKLVDRVVARATELGFNSIGRKDVVLPLWFRG